MIAYPLISVSGPAARHCSTASYPEPREIMGVGRRPPAGPVAPGAPAPPPARRPPSAAPAAPVFAPALRPPPKEPGARSTTGGRGARARLAATAALNFATFAV